ncbi:MAG: Cysteine--tRNA ligase [Anaerolinea thermophila]|uniref:Cysteine--tRNA ligase n=1 Tax=Anaerolinea thermophila TaxID=167964 RepID=A0A101FYB9_9CHLR|nr:MAG: Cysteine--tRNA ligase [Anaerolinea thermophila]
MTLRVYNTLTRKKEPFKTIEDKKVRLYVCGPTVYDNAHVGHAMSTLVFDIIRRYLEYRGYQVQHVMNYTDVDDKIIQRANALGKDPQELAQTYIDKYDQHLQDLNILPATFKPRATGEMQNIIDFIQELIDKDYAYAVGGDVYYRVRKFDSYGKLSHRNVDEMRSGARISVDERKEDPLDFALWKGAKPGEPSWHSPWGEGRPGWHIECSAMSMAHLGEQIDIHGGGNELVFPHHENEIAQSEALTGKNFATYWMHNGLLQLNGEKMSKSVGNLITIEDFLKNHPADVMRLMVLNSGYRNPLTFNDEVIEQAHKALERLQSGLKPELPGAEGAPAEDLTALVAQVSATRIGFETCMDDDFNSAGALGNLFDLVRVINQARADGATQNELEEAQTALRKLSSVLGLQLEISIEAHAADAFVDLLVELRTELRTKKEWALSDRIRDQLLELGVALEDSAKGSTWRWQ